MSFSIVCVLFEIVGSMGRIENLPLCPVGIRRRVKARGLDKLENSREPPMKKLHFVSPYQYH
ncbi:hypothetical protein V1477_017349 [Vespula maculifrons]|uniref:Uncharacterized protein n=1 Tax=Vespula maculifrons TaxID=7453 RepID=A0ABD2B630_VESMC